MKIIAVICALLTGSFASAASTGAELQKNLRGRWKLAGVTCNGTAQELPLEYVMTFQGKTGEYISKAKSPACTQRELETYTYLSSTQVAIQQGKRVCLPNPCAADLPASECGKETNPKLPVFDVTFSDHDKKMLLSTNDPNSIDCTAAGQSKPAVFSFERLSSK